MEERRVRGHLALVVAAQPPVHIHDAHLLVVRLRQLVDKHTTDHNVAQTQETFHVKTASILVNARLKTIE